MKRTILPLCALFVATALPLSAQRKANTLSPADSIRTVDGRQGLDTVYAYALPAVYVVHRWRPKFAPLSNEEREEYWKRIRDVKRVMPYADMVSDMLIETYEYMETLPDNRARRKHLKRFEKELKDKYMPEMKKLTRSQGQLLMKLIDRKIGSTPYEIIKAFYGSFTAGFYSLFAEYYGGKLNSRYDPRYNKDDALTERIIYLYEKHLLG